MSKYSKVLCIGDAFVDNVTNVPSIPKSGEGVWGTPAKMYGGGTAANVASGLAKLSVPVGFVGIFGRDQNAQFLIDDLEKSGVDVSYCIQNPSYSTGSTFILVEPSGERVIVACAIDASYTKLSDADVEFILEESSQFESIYLTGVLLGNEPAQSTLFNLADKIKGKSNLFFDPNLRHPLDAIPINLMEAMQEMATKCDYVLTGEAEGAALKLQPKAGQLFIEKCGAQGARIKTNDQIVASVDGYKVEVIDAIGAGDAFDAAFIAALTKEFPLESAVGFANAAAALSVTQPGARSMPGWDDSYKLWKNGKV